MALKREITSTQTVGHLEKIVNGETFDTILDIGAGEGAVLDKLHKGKIGETLGAVEISTSGKAAIEARGIPNLKSVEMFDGYHIPHPDKSYDLGLAIHVVEHVEHERMFLAEAAGVCKKLYVEVPLEHTRYMQRAIRISGQYGHINFYTPLSLENLLKTSGLQLPFRVSGHLAN